MKRGPGMGEVQGPREAEAEARFIELVKELREAVSDEAAAELLGKGSVYRQLLERKSGENAALEAARAVRSAADEDSARQELLNIFPEAHEGDLWDRVLDQKEAGTKE